MYRKIVTLPINKKLVIEWQESWKDLVVKMDNVVLGRVETKEELKGGRTFHLPDGKQIMVVLSDYGLEVWHEGVEVVSGTKSGTTDFFGSAFRAMMSTGTILMILGIVNLIPGSILRLTIFSITLFVLGLGLVVLGAFTRKNTSKSNFILGLVLGGLSFVPCFFLVSYLGFAAVAYLIAALTKGLKSQEYEPTVKITLNENDPIDRTF